MTLHTGTRLGPYEILAPLGAGGMGEVYRARDTRLDRDVAVKILRADVAADDTSRQRIEREARAISALNHPHICGLYDIGRHDETDYLVMELLPGESLAARLAKGPLPLERALSFAVQIAGALDAAHRAGVIHRDLKPGNIMLTPSGAKLLDFGVARLQPSFVHDQAGEATRLVAVSTGTGTLIGTTWYMAPEQIERGCADARSDLFALGVVIYEMLTGRRPFTGDTPAQVMSAILRDEPPPVTASQPALPAALDYVVGTCLAKDPEQRWQNARDLALALTGVGVANRANTSPPSVRSPWAKRMGAAGLIAVTALVALAAWKVSQRPTQAAREAVRFTITPPGKTGDDAVSISPDGRQIAFAASGPDGKPLLWVRSLDATAPRALPGTDEVVQHFWSPDMASIGFFAQGKLKKVNLTTGAVEALCNATNARGGTWGADNLIVMAPSTGLGLYIVPASGGEPKQLTTLDASRSERSHRWPVFLPDGRHFLFLNRSGSPEHSGVYLGSTTSSVTTRVVASASNAAYVAPGYLLFVRSGTLYAQRFDLGTLKVQDEAHAMPEPVRYDAGLMRADFSVSTNGVLAYRSGASVGARLTWRDRKGKPLGVVGAPAHYTNLGLSPDDGRIAATRYEGTGFSDLWVIDSLSGADSRLTFEPSSESNPVWSPDGQWIAFGSDRAGFFDLYRKRAAGGQDELLLSSPVVKYASSWSADNRYIVFEVDDPRTKLDIWILPLFGDRKPVPFLNTPFDEWVGQLAPNQKWMAYTSNESGRYEVYVQSFPPKGAKWQVSLNGGLHARWRGDGREIFYVGANQKLMAAAVRMEGTEFSLGRTQELFDLGIQNIFTVRSPYVVSRDGQRFLIADARTDVVSPVDVVLNWASRLSR